MPNQSCVAQWIKYVVKSKKILCDCQLKMRSLCIIDKILTFGEILPVIYYFIILLGYYGGNLITFFDIFFYFMEHAVQTLAYLSNLLRKLV